MAWKKLIGIVTSGALVSVVAFAGNGCSSSKTTNGNGATDGAPSDVATHHDGSSSSSSGSSSGGGDDSGDSSGGSFDGTTGKACTTDADCHTATGPGINKCSNDVLFTGGALFPTPICFMPAACDPGIDNNIHFCDGPDDPSSPGVCLPQTNPPQTGKGICLAQCNFKPDGSAATGCQGKDECNIYGIGSDTAGNPLGIGYCYNGCDTDADCTSAGAGQHCQADQGICLTTVVTTDLPIGTGCNATSTAMPACAFCFSNTSTNLGFCSSYCKIGGTECPSGWYCDAQLDSTLLTTTDASVAGWTSANPGLAGSCIPTCMAGGHTQLEGGACPTNSSCQTTDQSGTILGGPLCVP